MGIKMNSNEHGTMEQNEEHLVMNISIYQARKTEQYAMRYAMMNRATYCEKFGTWQKTRGEKSTCPDLDREGADVEVHRRQSWT